MQTALKESFYETPLINKPVEISLLTDGTNDHFVELEFSSKEDAQAFNAFVNDCFDIDEDLKDLCE